MQAEPGAERVMDCIDRACISAVNLSEAIAKMAERGFAESFIAESLDDMNLDVRAFDHQQAHSAGMLRPETRLGGLSFGDRACLTLARQLGAIALTTDKAWAKLDIGVEIELVR